MEFQSIFGNFTLRQVRIPLRTKSTSRLRQLCKMAKREENPQELARLLNKIDGCLSELNTELQEILGEVERLIRAKLRSPN